MLTLLVVIFPNTKIRYFLNLQNIMEIKDYWIDIDQRLDTLLKKGYVKLPSLSKFALDKIADGISSEMGDLTFKELTLAHKKLLNDLKIDEFFSTKTFC